MAEANTPALTRTELRELDRLATDEYGIPGIVLMENAGRGAADVVLAHVGHERTASERARPRVAIACGPGNNGGDGCVVARHLANAGLEVVLLVTEPLAALRGDAALARATVERMRLEIHVVGEAETLARAEPALARADLIVDALLGTGFAGGLVRPKIARVIESLNARGRPIIALDVPSGLDCDTGVPSVPTITADITATFAAPKVGFSAPAAVPYIGRVVLVSIGAPAELGQRVRGRARDV